VMVSVGGRGSTWSSGLSVCTHTCKHRHTQIQTHRQTEMHICTQTHTSRHTHTISARCQLYVFEVSPAHWIQLLTQCVSFLGAPQTRSSQSLSFIHTHTHTSAHTHTHT